MWWRQLHNLFLLAPINITDAFAYEYRTISVSNKNSCSMTRQWEIAKGNNLIKTRKIIHVDMDCFFAAVEVRDNPSLKGRPVAVGGKLGARGVLSTCNYEARKYGLHSAMPTSRALMLCPKLVLLPVDISKYKSVSKVLYRIFRQYTPLVEMLSLDEAFLDVTDCEYCKGSATLIAKTIKNRIKKELQLTASAGVAPNKFLAKVASDWLKPDGLFVITPDRVEEFIKDLPVTKIFGVGKVTAKKLHDMNIMTCADLQKETLFGLSEKFGKMGSRFYQLCRGIDDREVNPKRQRKSVSVEKTFPKDLVGVDEVLLKLPSLINRLRRNLSSVPDLKIKKHFIKIKFNDFKLTTAEVTNEEFSEKIFYDLIKAKICQHNKPIRLLGVGIRGQA